MMTRSHASKSGLAIELEFTQAQLEGLEDLLEWNHVEITTKHPRVVLVSRQDGNLPG
jgi:hypothetical protein